MKNDIFAKPQIHLLIVAIIGLCIYSNTFNSPFVFDDIRFIADNPTIKDLHYFENPSEVQTLKILPELRHAFRTRILGHFSFALNYKLNGLDVTGYHVFNFIVHIVNALLVYWLVLLTFCTPFFELHGKRKGDFDIRKYQNSIAFASALLFVSHPIQTQAITYITQRFASLATLFYVLSFVLYVKSRVTQAASKRYVSYAISLIAAILAMLTKEISFTLPAVIALYEFMFFEGKAKRRLLRLVPFGLTMFIIPYSLMAANSSGMNIGGLGASMRNLAISHEVSRWEYLITEFRVIVTYFRLLIFPVNQNLYYDYPIYRSLFIPSVLSSLLLLLTIAFSAVSFFCRSLNEESRDRHSFRLLAFGIFWFFMTLSMESSIIPIKDVIFEHRLYLPSVGLFFAFSTAVLLIINRLNRSAFSVEQVGMSILLPVVLILSGTSYARNSVWKSEISLWEDVVKKSPAMGYNHTELALAYERHGRTEDAIRTYKKAIEVDPDHALSHNNLGLHYAKLGRMEEAIDEYRQAVRISPGYYKAFINLGVVYYSLGRDEDAIREYQMALEIYPEFPVAHFNLGLAYERLGRVEEAIREYQIATSQDLDFLEAYYQLGLNYQKQGRFEEAAKAFQTVLKLNPNHVGARQSIESLMRVKR
jgi:tetratricopeptide (TPR) repeat protein